MTPPSRPARHAALACLVAVLAAAPAGAQDALPLETGLPKGLAAPTAKLSWSGRPVVALQAHAQPSASSRVVGRISPIGELGGGDLGLLVTAVRTTTEGTWVRVILPLRPNGNLGWVPADSLQLHATAVRILVDQSQRQLTMFRAGRVVLRTRVAIGAPATPTPNGRFSIAEVIRTDNPAGFIGPFVLPLTAFSNVLDTFDGGNGRVALHGTSVPSQLGQRVSHGCVRIRNTDLMRIVRAITPGVPVTVRA
ncbi:MAG: L,D-transpeptidase [Thermoleophilia bacterium]